MKRLDDWMRPHRQGRYGSGDAQKPRGVTSSVVIVASFFVVTLFFGLFLLDRPFWDAALVASTTAAGAAVGVVLAVAVRRRRSG
jgi:hypothetical protein